MVSKSSGATKVNAQVTSKTLNPGAELTVRE
jgi:hypothetical protein